MASPPRSGPATSRAATGSDRRWKSASPGSTAGSCATCARPSAEPSSQGSAAKAACTRSISIPSRPTYASSCERRPAVLKPLDFQKWIEEHRHLLKPPVGNAQIWQDRSEEHTSELQSLTNLVCRLLLEKKKKKKHKKKYYKKK